MTRTWRAERKRGFMTTTNVPLVRCCGATCPTYTLHAGGRALAFEHCWRHLPRPLRPCSSPLTLAPRPRTPSQKLCRMRGASPRRPALLCARPHEAATLRSSYPATRRLWFFQLVSVRAPVCCCSVCCVALPRQGPVARWQGCPATPASPRLACAARCRQCMSGGVVAARFSLLSAPLLALAVEGCCLPSVVNGWALCLVG